MGSKGAAKIYTNKKVKVKGIRIKKLKEYKDKKTAGDISVFMHRWKYCLPENNKYFLIRALEFIQILFQLNIKFTGVFDGPKSPSWKIVELERKLQRELKKENYLKALESEQQLKTELDDLETQQSLFNSINSAINNSIDISINIPLENSSPPSSSSSFSPCSNINNNDNDPQTCAIEQIISLNERIEIEEEELKEEQKLEELKEEVKEQEQKDNKKESIEIVDIIEIVDNTDKIPLKIVDVSQKILEKRNALVFQQEDTIARGRQHISIHKEDYTLLKELLDIIGIAWIAGSEMIEADFILATLARHNIVDFVLSNDSDMQAHGVPFSAFFYNPNQYKKKKKIQTKNENKQQDNEVGGEEEEQEEQEDESIVQNESLNPESTLREFSIDELLPSLKLNMSMYRDVFILCKCDYSNGMKKIGPSKALEWIWKYESVENMLPMEVIKKYDEIVSFRLILSSLDSKDSSQQISSLLEQIKKAEKKAEKLLAKAKIPEPLRKVGVEGIWTFWKEYEIALTKFGIEVPEAKIEPKPKLTSPKWNTLVEFLQSHITISSEELKEKLYWMYEHFEKDINSIEYNKKENQEQYLLKSTTETSKTMQINPKRKNIVSESFLLSAKRIRHSN